jgi:glycine/sarcosine N-methyltransferase
MSAMPDTTQGPAGFYDDLAATYDRLYPDWAAAVRTQGSALHRLLVEELGEGPHRVHDAAAGGER